MAKLDNKIAVITGGNSGIGFATAERFIREGAEVLITGRKQHALEEAVEKLGPKAKWFLSDASKMEDIKKLGTHIRENYDRVDILFVNAGVAFFAPIDQVSEELYDTMFDINVKGLYFTIQEILPSLSEGGSIILNASIAAHKGMISASIYAATKAAVNSLARTLASELAPRKIRVNSVSPGPISTPIYNKMGLPAEQADAFAGSILEQVPLNRFGSPNEIAEAVTFLGSSESSYVTGSELVVDGGMVHA